MSKEQEEWIVKHQRNIYTVISKELELLRFPHPITGEKGDEFCGWFKIKLRSSKHEPLMAFVCYAAGMGWEHASITLNRKRTPTWEEMCQIKNMFWTKDKAVFQLHPPEKDYVNNHPYCLHLWRPVDCPVPMPPKIMV